MFKINPSLPQIIKAAMIMKKLDQRTLAAKMGLTVATVNHKINLKQKFDLDEIILIMKILNLDFNRDFVKWS